MEGRDLRAAVVSAGAIVAGAVAGLIARARLGQAARLAAAGARGALRRWERRPGGRSRHLRQLASEPLLNLYDVYPEARRATPREIGLRSLAVDEIAGTAVGGLTQRGADFKPLPAFRSQNWVARWQRIRNAVDRLAILPPIDVVRYPPGERYWVSDGHNRVAAALEFGQVEIDANVTELVPPGENPSERPGDLAAALAGSRSLRAAAQGGRLRTVEDDVVLGVPGREDGEATAPAPAGPPDVAPPPAVAPAPEVAPPASDPTGETRRSGAPDAHIAGRRAPRAHSGQRTPRRRRHGAPYAPSRPRSVAQVRQTHGTDADRVSWPPRGFGMCVTRTRPVERDDRAASGAAGPQPRSPAMEPTPER